MARYVLAGDIGGTKTSLAIYAFDRAGEIVLVRDASFPSRQYGGLEQVLEEFLHGGGERVAAAAFGIAGPVVGDAVTTTNLPWRVEAAGLARVLGGARVRLMNDLETTAYGALFLPPSSLLILNEGRERPGNRAVIAAGTGLGQAFLFWNGTDWEPSATEGGHVDFAPRDDLEVELLQFLRTLYPHVSYERVLSGSGLVNIFSFFRDARGRPVAASVAERLAHEDPAAVIGEAGVAGTCATCVGAVDLFLSLYGAQAGNLALAVMAYGGVYVGGGIVIKMRPRLTAGPFMRSFTAKGRYADLVSAIPVRIILDPTTSRLGAAHAGRALAT
jgi:glucokinase